MLTQDEYNEIEQRMADKEMMIDILSKQLNDKTNDLKYMCHLNARNVKRIRDLDQRCVDNKQWIDKLELINAELRFDARNNNQIMRFFAPITRKLRAFFCAK
jgi:uncharacterized coiled-coil protein SlyX